jgi:hypothetical protein
VTIAMPAGQKALVPGRLVEELESAERYRARFEFAHPSDGIDLIAGPYRVGNRDVRTAGGKAVRLRTYFHPEIATLAQWALKNPETIVNRQSAIVNSLRRRPSCEPT